VTQDDLLYRFRLRVFAMAAELGNVRAACRAMGIHPSTFYSWKRQLDRHGPEILRPRERRPPRMANQTSVLVEQRVVAFALGHPGFGPARIAAELAQPRWGAIQLSTNGGCGGCCAATACPPEPSAMGWWPATRRHRRRSGRSRRPSGICRSAGLGSWSSSAASALVACRAPRAPSGTTRPSMWPRPMPGRPCRSPGATPRPTGPASSPARLPPTSPAAVGGWSGS
jgi:Helix-turn-helix domain